ncbi:MAG: hypothetical protein WD768_22645 [Phycisphaeraceae bacterium]
MPSNPNDLFKRVATRSRLASLGLWTFRFALIFAGVYALLFLLSHVLGLLPDWWFGDGDYRDILSVGLVPLAAILFALTIHRGITQEEAARLVDVRMNTKDLFLTAATLSTAPGEYKPLVTAAAMEQATQVRPQVVVPWNPWNRLSYVIIALALLCVGAAFLKPMDLFGQHEEQKETAQRIKRLEQQKVETKAKVEALEKEDLTAKTSAEVQKMLDELKKNFNELKKDEKEKNIAKLTEQQKQISDKWRELNEQKNREAQRDRMAQQLGGVANMQKTQEWKKELAEGKTDAMQKEVQELKKLAEKMDKAEGAEKNQIKQEMQKRIQEMNDFTKNNGSSKELSESLKQALEQLAQSGDKQTQEQAMDALKESMNLSEKELEQMAQSIRDQKSLEEAMQAIQNAKQANSQDKADGSQTGQCENMKDYAELFKKLGGGQEGEGGTGSEGDKLAQGQGQGQKGDGQGDGQGDPSNGQGGTGGEGQGRGGKPPEGPDINAGFKSEKSKSHLQAGKTLLDWKTNELPEAGESKAKYQEAVKDVKQGVAEAIIQEQVPPGYHDAIKRYFDSVAPPAKDAPKPEAKKE